MWIAGAIVFGVFLFCVYAMFEARTLRVVRHEIKTPKIHGDPVRIAFVADIHINRWNGWRTLRRLGIRINEERPDIILLGGDTVDGRMDRRSRELDILRNLKAPLGKFAVLGNHEVPCGIGQSVDFLERAGFHVLRGETVEVGEIVIVGVDDPKASKAEGTDAHQPFPLLCPGDGTVFTVLLKHRPSVQVDCVGLFDLQLSGHTHGGQIWPARYLMHKYHKTQTGLSEIEASGKASTLFVSVGSGFSRLPFRFFTPPEIVVFDLVPAKRAWAG